MGGMGSGSKGLGFRFVFPNEHVFPQRFMMQRLVLDTTLHDNHLLNFLLQLQRYVEDPCIDIPFIFDINGRTLELEGRYKDRSKFRERGFLENPNLNGERLLDLVKNDVAFNNLDDDDVVHVCLLLALDYILTPTSIEMNEPWLKSSLEYFTKVTTPNPVLRSDTKGSSSSRSVHTCVRTEVRREIALYLIKFSKNDNYRFWICNDDYFHLSTLQKHKTMGYLNLIIIVSVKVGGLDHQSMERVSHCMYSEHLDKNWNDVYENHPVDGLDHQRLGKAWVSPYVLPPPTTEVKCKKRRLTTKKPTSKKIIKSVIGADGNEIALLPWNEDLTRSPNAPKRSISVPEEIMSLFCDKKKMEMHWTFSWLYEGYTIKMDFWERLVGRSASKRGWLADDHIDIWIEYLWHFRQPNDDWAMASPYLSDMLSRYELPLYYANGSRYGVPWFATGVEKVYFPVNKKDFHWCLAELHIRSGVIMFYDSLGRPSNGTEDRIF
nr:ulp1 protease family, C-terminal catalytic domain-containing protein [Tanacetum cinerariifolium]